MRILDLQRLRPGDIVLETGEPAAGRATGGPFGHAAVALGRLVKIEAGKEDGVELNPFSLVALRRGDQRVVGSPVEPGDDVRVLRRREPLPNGTIMGEALWEAGRAYSVPKLLQLRDLKPSWRRRLQERIPENPEPASREALKDMEGRFCSEVAARILQLPESAVSPNCLASAPELVDVTEALLELDHGWKLEPLATAELAVGSKLSQVRLGMAKIAICQLRQAAKRVRQSGSPVLRKVEAAALEESLTGEIQVSMQILHSIEELEPSILTSLTSSI